MNVVGRLRGLNISLFLRCIKLLEEKLVDDSQVMSLIDLNQFLDGVVQSHLTNGNVIVK